MRDQVDRRHVKFNLDALCTVAAATGGESSPIEAIEKMEGGFSKALLLKKENGAEVIAKIPCRNAGPPVHTTASEVATLQFGEWMPFHCVSVCRSLTSYSLSEKTHRFPRPRGARLEFGYVEPRWC